VHFLRLRLSKHSLFLQILWLCLESGSAWVGLRGQESNMLAPHSPKDESHPEKNSAKTRTTVVVSKVVSNQIPLASPIMYAI
jgi:hypothetical protein